MTHQHDFNSLWRNFSPRWRQDVHLHWCETMHCDVELVGVGHECGGPDTTHVEKRLIARWLWDAKEQEGQLLSDEGTDSCG